MKLFENINTGEQVKREPAQVKEAPYDGSMLIFETDMNGVITYASRNTREVLEYTKEELEGAPFAISIHPDIPEGIYNEAFKVAAEGNVWSGYMKSITQKGESFWTTMCVQGKYTIDKSIDGFIIRKKHADEKIVEMVKEEYETFKDLMEGEYSSEYSRALQFKHYKW